jgi:hypothetical protein
VEPPKHSRCYFNHPDGISPSGADLREVPSVTGAVGAALFAVVISTSTKAREFKFDDLDAGRASANDLWRWAKSNDEPGSITLYEQRGAEWFMVQHEQV